MSENQPNPFNPFQALQVNASSLFDQIAKKHSAHMNCQKGCSRCCYAEFSIFLGEAQLILEWFQKLNDNQKTQLANTWAKKDAETPVITTAKPCAFLRSGGCTIYEARPIICRTQGAPLSFLQEGEPAATDKKSHKNHGKKSKANSDDQVRVVDVCPLNFDEGKNIPKNNSDWFELDRLASLQSIAQNYLNKNSMLSEELKALMDENERISLRKLQNFLSVSISSP